MKVDMSKHECLAGKNRSYWEAQFCSMHQRSAKAGSCWLRVKLWLKREQTNLADPLPWAKQTLTAVIVASCLWSSSIPLKVLQAGGTAVFWRSVDKWYFWSFWFWSDLRHLDIWQVRDQPPKKLETTVSQRGSQQVSAWPPGTARHVPSLADAKPRQKSQWQRLGAHARKPWMPGPCASLLSFLLNCFIASYHFIFHPLISPWHLTLFQWSWSLVRLYSHQWMLGMLNLAVLAPHRWLVGFRLPRSLPVQSKQWFYIALDAYLPYFTRIPCERGHQSSTNRSSMPPGNTLLQNLPHPLQTTNRPAK